MNPEPTTGKPTEEMARVYIALMMNTTPDKVVNVEIVWNGMSWEFFGNLKIDKPRYFGVLEINGS